MSYKSTHTGEQIDTGVSAALNPDTTVTPSSTALVTSGAVDTALGGIKGIYPCTTSTTYAQIASALAAGKLPVCKYNGKLYTCTDYSTANLDTVVRFGCVEVNTLLGGTAAIGKFLECSETGDTWSAYTVNLVDDAYLSNRNYATQSYVDTAIGDRIFIVEYGTMNPTSDYDKIAAAIASGFAVLCRFRLDTSTPVYYYAPLTEKRTLSGKEWYVFESVLNNNQTSGWSNIFGAALLQRRILEKIDNTCSWALETVALPCPDAPTGNGNYKLRLMKTRNGMTFSWVSDT